MLLRTAFTAFLPLFAFLTATTGNINGELDSEELLARFPDGLGLDTRDFFDGPLTDDYDLRSYNYEDIDLRSEDYGDYGLRSVDYEDFGLRSEDYGDFDLRSSDYFEDAFERRAKGSVYPVKGKKTKVSGTNQKARKDSVRSRVATNQISNAIRKGNLKAAAANAPPYRAPRNPRPGYRAQARAQGRRLPKQPKTPKPQMKKGNAPSAKAQARQAAANQRTRDQKKAGRIEFAGAKVKYAATANMPHRKSTFTKNGDQ